MARRARAPQRRWETRFPPHGLRAAWTTTTASSWSSPSRSGSSVGCQERLDLHERGYRMCQCYSRLEPEGEFRHMTEARLLAIPLADFREALGLLHADDLPEYEECVYNAAADADRSPAASD